ncbi:MAG: alpha/beta hydrolase, partial [Candidatus Nanopelagicales bacterium]|nr:alpha/beta hydrolase [Candidatus Nanopelagicales bacterium]
ANAKSFTIIASDNDRWLPRGIKIYEEALQQKAVVLPGAGHFSLDDGWGPWPALLLWIEDPESSPIPNAV